MQHRKAPRSAVALVAALALGTTLLLSGCGGKTTTTSSNAAGQPANQSTVQATGAADNGNGCPVQATRAFAKTRAAINAGLALGAFHRYLYKPYNKGTFKKGVNGRKRALVKGAAATAFIIFQLNQAKKNVMANPTLCNAIKNTYSNITGAFSSLRGKLVKSSLLGTDVGPDIQSDASMFEQFQSKTGFNENTAVDVPAAD